MKRSTLFGGFLVCLVLAVSGFNAYGNSQRIAIDFQGDPASRALLDRSLKRDPQIAVPRTQSEYSIRVIKPNPSLDYTIVQITPDPSIDYSIITIDPSPGRELAELSQKPGSALREKLRQKQKEPNK